MIGILFTMMNMVTYNITNIENFSKEYFTLLFYVALISFLTIYIKIIILLECKLNTCMNKNLELRETIDKLTKDIKCKDDALLLLDKKGELSVTEQVIIIAEKKLRELVRKNDLNK